MLGAITSDQEWAIERGVWKLRAAQAKAKGEPMPAKPHRVKGDPKAVVPDGLLVGQRRA